MASDLKRFSNFHDLLDEWKRLLGRLAESPEDFRKEDFTRELEKRLQFGSAGVLGIVGVEQEVLDEAGNDEQRAFLAENPDATFIRTRIALKLAADLSLALEDFGQVAIQAGKRIGLLIEVPVRFMEKGPSEVPPALADLLASLEARIKAVDALRKRIVDATLAAVFVDEEGARKVGRGSRFELRLDLEGSLDTAKGTPLAFATSASSSVRASYTARGEGSWRVSVQRPTQAALDVAAKVPLLEDFSFGFSFEIAALRRHSRIYEVELDRHGSAFIDSLPWRKGAGMLIRVNADPLERAGVPSRSSLEAMVDVDYSAEVAGMPYPGASLSAAFTRKATRHVAASYGESKATTGVARYAYKLAALGVDAAAIAPKGARVAHLTGGSLGFLGKVKAGRSITFGELAKLSVNAGLSAGASRSSLLSLRARWVEQGQPLVEVEEKQTDELKTAISAAAGLELQEEAVRGEIESLIESHLAELDLPAELGDGLDEVKAKGLDAGLKAIQQYLNASAELGTTLTRSRSESIVCGPFNLSDPTHRVAFVALRADHDIEPALRAGLVTVRGVERSKRDEVKARLNLLGQAEFTDASWNEILKSQKAFSLPGDVKGTVAGVEVKGGEDASYQLLFGRKETADVDWKGVAVTAQKGDNPRTLEAVMLTGRAEIDDGFVEAAETWRWRVLRDQLRSWEKIDLLPGRTAAPGGDEGRPGKGLLAFAVNRRGLRNILETPLFLAHRTFLTYAALVEGAPGAPPCESYERVPMTYRMLRLLRMDDKREARARFEAEFGGLGLTLENLEEARQMVDDYPNLRGDEADRSADVYRNRFQGDIGADAIRFHAAEELRRYRERSRRQGRPASNLDLERPARRYEALTGRSRHSYREGLRPDGRWGFMEAELRMLFQEDVFSKALVDLQQQWRESSAGEPDLDLQTRLFQRLSRFAHAITPSSVTMLTRDRLQAYLTVHALTLLALARPEGFSVSEFAYQSELLAFEAVKRPGVLAVGDLIDDVLEGFGVQI